MFYVLVRSKYSSTMLVFLLNELLMSCFLTLKGVVSIKLLELHVDEYVYAGVKPNLICRWKLEHGELLYSVKWYKDSKEFFSYIPKADEPQRKFSLDGVNVEASDSYGSNIVLSAAKQATGGRYRCEVSGEKPHFFTATEYKDMVVILPPKTSPTISGFHFKYSVGDELKLSCTLGPSHPPAQLTWYINGELFPSKEVFRNSVNRTTIRLDYIIKEADFNNRQLRVKCLSTIPPIYWRSIEKIATQTESNIIDSNSVISKANGIFIFNQLTEEIIFISFVLMSL